MSAITVTTHRARLGTDVEQWVRDTAPAIAAAVERHFGRGLEPVTIVLTDPHGREEMYWQVTAEMADGTQPNQNMRRLARNAARHTVGQTVINPRGGALILLDGTDRSMRKSETALRTLAHEFVHCDQLGRPGIREARIAGIRHNLGVEIDNARARTINAMTAKCEYEAYRLEKPLAQQALKAVA